MPIKYLEIRLEANKKVSTVQYSIDIRLERQIFVDADPRNRNCKYIPAHICTLYSIYIQSCTVYNTYDKYIICTNMYSTVHM